MCDFSNCIIYYKPIIFFVDYMYILAREYEDYILEYQITKNCFCMQHINFHIVVSFVTHISIFNTT